MARKLEKLQNVDSAVGIRFDPESVDGYKNSRNIVGESFVQPFHSGELDTGPGKPIGTMCVVYTIKIE